MIVAAQPPTRPDLEALIALFYSSPSELGQFQRVEGDALPPAYRQLLDHEHHMTVTVEEFHGSAVEVQVLEVNRDASHYSRKITLSRQSDDAVVQFGLVRLDVSVLQPEVRMEIESERTPLGRVLIKHRVLRDVELHGLYRVQCGADLAQIFGVSTGTETYGRTAMIYCNGEPAVELLEIMAPLTQSD